MDGYGAGSGVNQNATRIAARISHCRDVFQKAVRGRRRKNIKTRESHVVSLDDVTREWLQSRLGVIKEITDEDVLEKDIGLRIDDYSEEEGLKKAVWDYFWSMSEYASRHSHPSFRFSLNRKNRCAIQLP